MELLLVMETRLLTAIDLNIVEEDEDDENETTAPLNSGEVKCLILVVTAV